MSTRMEKYDNISLDNMSRTKRNQNIYSSTDIGELSRIKTNTNVSIISDASKEIDIDKIRNYVNSLSDEKDEKRKRISLELPEENEVVIERKEEKDYDINSVLERAKDNRETDYEEDRHRKLNNTQIDILKSIKIQKDNNDLTDPIDSIDELNTQEKTIVDLIQNIKKNSKESKEDLFEELMSGNDNTMVMPPIEEDARDDSIKQELLNMTQELELIKQPENEFTKEISAEKNSIKDNKSNDSLDLTLDETDGVPKITEVDKSFYTNSTTFNKSDFEGFDDLEKETKKSGVFTKIAVFLIIILLIATIFLILNFIFEWNLI